MKPGLITPRFYPTEVIEADKIDRYVRLLAEQINGGLSAQSISPGERLASSLFVENRGVFFISAFAASTVTDPLFVSPYDCRMIGIGFSTLAGSPSTTTVNVMNGTTTVFTTQVSQSTVAKRTFEVPDFQIDFPAGAIIGVRLGVSLVLPYVTLAFSAAHI